MNPKRDLQQALFRGFNILKPCESVMRSKNTSLPKRICHLRTPAYIKSLLPCIGSCLINSKFKRQILTMITFFFELFFDSIATMKLIVKHTHTGTQTQRQTKDRQTDRRTHGSLPKGKWRHRRSDLWTSCKQLISN